jgi:peptide/nickel transport system substrate-binding protein
MDALLKKEQGTEAPDQRADVITDAQQLAAQDAPIIPYWQGAMIAVAQKDVQGIDDTLDPTFIMRFWLISKD